MKEVLFRFFKGAGHGKEYACQPTPYVIAYSDSMRICRELTMLPQPIPKSSMNNNLLGTREDGTKSKLEIRLWAQLLSLLAELVRLFDSCFDRKVHFCRTNVTNLRRSSENAIIETLFQAKDFQHSGSVQFFYDF